MLRLNAAWPTRIVTALLLALLAATVLVSQSAQASLDNKGKDFLLGFMPNTLSSGHQVEVHLTGDVATTVSVEYPAYAPTFSTTASVIPGSVTIVSLPTSASTSWSPDAIGANLVRASSNDEFIAYMVNIRRATSDAALALPIDTMNTEYIVLDYNPRFVGAMFLVYAAFNGTDVTITPSSAIVGRPAGVPFTVTLNKGEGYFARSSSTAASNTLTGTTISASRPVGLTNGNGCTQVPTGTFACDHIFEVAQPVQSWGNEIGVANLPQRPNGSVYRVLASQDGTSVTLDGAPLATLNKGDFHETAPISGNHVFRGHKPIYVAQYMTGDGYPGATQGDPAMGNMIPFAQYLNSYTFSTVGGSQFATNYVTIIAENSDVGLLTLDGVPVPASDYTPIPTTSYSATVQSLSDGSHTTASNSGHGITVEGFNSFDSYIYPGGALFKFINPTGDANPPIVDLDPPSGIPPEIDGIATDDRPTEDSNGNEVLDPGEDLNGNGQIDDDTGIFFVELDPGSTNLTLTVDPFTPGDPSATFTVGLVNPALNGTGSITVTDGAGNETTVSVVLVANQPPTADAGGPYLVNEGSAVALNAVGSTDPDGTPDIVSYDWDLDNDGQFDDASGVTASFFGSDGPSVATVGVEVCDSAGACDTDTTTVTVNNVAPTVLAIPASQTLNETDTATVDVKVSDPGVPDTCTLVIDWGEGSPETHAVSCNGTVTLTHQYADDNPSGTASDNYGVSVTVTDDDTGVGTAATSVTVNNVAPELTLDTTGSVILPSGLQAFLGRKDVSQTHDATATDAGPDDLTFDWNSGQDMETYPSGGVFPFSATDTGTVTYGAPGVTSVDVMVTDDDTGSDSDSLAKLIVDDCDCTKSKGFWKKQTSEKRKGNNLIPLDALDDYLDVVDAGSAVFGAMTLSQANGVLDPKPAKNGSKNGSGSGSNSKDATTSGGGSRKKEDKDSGSASGSSTGSGAKKLGKAKAQALAAWLNFAKGAIGWDELVDTDRDKVGDMTFGDIIAEVELILSNPNATDADLERAKDLAEAVNVHDKKSPDCDTGSGSATKSGSVTGTKATGSDTGTGTGTGSKN